MAKPAFHGGKPTFINSKPMIGCCCCLEPEYQGLWPPNNDYIFVNSGLIAHFWCRVESRYSDDIELHISTDGGSSFDLKAKTGIGSNPTGGTTPTYSSSFVSTSLTSRTDPNSFPSQPYSPGTTILWKLKISNNCGKSIWTPARIFRFVLYGSGSQKVDCNSCSPGLKKTFAAVFSGLNGAPDDPLDDFVSYPLPNVVSTPATNERCQWNSGGITGSSRIAVIRYNWNELSVAWTLGLSASAIGGCPGGTSCFVSWSVPGSPCTPVLSFDSGDIVASGTTCCGGTLWGPITATVS